jgi:hypothetical protein
MSTLLHAISYSRVLLSTILHGISYRGALLSTLLHAISYREARARGSVMVKAICYKPEGRGFDSR